MATSHLRLVSGNGDETTTIVSSSASSMSQGLQPIGLYDENGNQYFKGVIGEGRSSSGGGGDGSSRLTLPDIRWNVAILNGLAGIFLAGMVGMFLWLVDRIDDRFEVADGRNREIAKEIGDMRTDLTRFMVISESSAKKMEEKIDEQNKKDFARGGSVDGDLVK